MKPHAQVSIPRPSPASIPLSDSTALAARYRALCEREAQADAAVRRLSTQWAILAPHLPLARRDALNRAVQHANTVWAIADGKRRVFARMHPEVTGVARW